MISVPILERIYLGVEAEGALKWPRVTEVLKSAGVVDTRFYTEAGRDAGTALHEAAALDDAGDLDEDSVDPIIRGKLEAWRRFREQNFFIPLASEAGLFHPTYKYRGTADRIGVFAANRKRLVVIDLKPSRERWHALQLWAYAECVPLNFMRDGGKVGFPELISVQLSANGAYKMHHWTVHELSNSRAAFLGALAIYNWKEGGV